MRLAYQSLYFRCTLLLFLSAVSLSETKAQTFNPDNALIMTREKSKAPGILFNGFRIKCVLNSGEKVKGDLFIYPDHIEVDTARIAFGDIKSIRHLNNNVYTRLASQLVLSELIRQSSGATGTQGLGYTLGINTVLTVINLTLLQRKYKPEKGWKFTVQDMSAIRRGRRR